jgi:L-lysine 6-transaminase
LRDAALADLRDVESVLALPCGERSLRFRPALSVSQDEIDEAVSALGRSVTRIVLGKEPVQ